MHDVEAQEPEDQLLVHQPLEDIVQLLVHVVEVFDEPLTDAFLLLPYSPSLQDRDLFRNVLDLRLPDCDGLS